MKALLLWAESTSPNLGVRALAAGTKKLLVDTWPGITVDTMDDLPAENHLAISGKSVINDLIRVRGPIREIFEKYDLIVDTGGGDSFSDIYGLKRLLIMAYAHEVAHRTRVPVVMGPQTLGPFKSPLAKFIGRRMLTQAAIVYSRDPISTTVARSLGHVVDRTVTDVAFALPAPTATEKKGVVVNVSGLLWDRNPHVDHHQYRNSVALLVDKLLASGREVTFLAHVLDNRFVDSDTRILSQLASLFGNAVDIVNPDGLDEVRNRLAQAEVVIGARMHACLNALSVGTPAIAWAYSRKFEPLMKDLGWDHVVDLRTNDAPVDATMTKIDRLSVLLPEALAVRERASKKLDDVVIGLRAKALFQ